MAVRNCQHGHTSPLRYVKRGSSPGKRIVVCAPRISGPCDRRRFSYPGEVPRMSKDLTVDALTPEQAAFASAYVDTGSAIDAYIVAYNPADSRVPATLRKRAHQVLHTLKVSNRIREINASAIAQAAR